MIRIIGGSLSGRVVEQPKTIKTRPMTQKVRGSIFNRLGDINGLRVIDAYAGSGAIGIEALSRGADYVIFVEKARAVAKTIRVNLETLGLLDRSELLNIAIPEALKHLQAKSFDLIIVDPPYKELNIKDIEAMTELLTSQGLLIISQSSKIPSPKLKAVDFIDARTYGDTTISYYRVKIT